tara:strand:- start:242 stop:1000 length:759 start_codon:yes stop_codon:yes gene_type:complete
MSTITSYLYEQKLQVTTTDVTAGNTMSMFYTPNIKVYRGIDNPVRVNFVNRDQKKVSLTDKTVSFVMIDKDTNKTILTRSVDDINTRDGIVELTLRDVDTYNLSSKYYTYAFKVTNGEGRVQIGYADDNYGAGGVLELVEGVYPTFNASTEETFGSGDTGSIIYLDPNDNRNTALHSAQVYFSSAFTGTLTVAGSLDPAASGLSSDNFTTIQTETYTAQEDNAAFSWNGIYSAIRFTRATTSGTLSKVLYRP